MKAKRMLSKRSIESLNFKIYTRRFNMFSIKISRPDLKLGTGAPIIALQPIEAQNFEAIYEWLRQNI